MCVCVCVCVFIFLVLFFFPRKMARQTSTQLALVNRKKKNPIETYKGFQINISAGIGDYQIKHIFLV